MTILHYAPLRALLTVSCWLALLILEIATTRNAVAEPAEFVWARAFGGANYDESGDLAIDTEGNVHITGFATPPNMFSTGAAPIGSGAGGFFLAKADRDGRLLWSQHGLPGSSRSTVTTLTSGPGVTVDNAGNVCVTGWFENSIRFGEITLTSRGGMDLFVARFDPSGKPLWAHRIGGAELEETGDIAVDATGHIYVTGGFRGPASLDDTELPLFYGLGVFVAKFDLEGNLQWIQEGRGSLTYLSLTADAQGHTVVAGQTRGSPVTIGGTTLTNSLSGGTLAAKFDTQGNFLWAKTSSAVLPRVALDKSGNTYLAGRYPEPPPGGAGFFYSDPFIAKYSASGDLLWTNRASGSVNWVAIALDPEGNPYLTSTFTRELSFGAATLRTTTSASELFVAKFDSRGKFLSARQGGGLSPRSMVIDGAGQIYVAGDSGGSPIFGDTVVPGFGDSDVYVAKLTAGPSLTEPKITSQPLSQTVWAESAVHFTAFATGLRPLSFQWKFNRADLANRTNAWLTLSNITTTMAGNYSVIVSNALASVTSSTATLTVNTAAPQITVQPGSQTVQAGLDVSFSVEATGVPRPFFQWRREGQNLPGETNRTLNLPRVTAQHAGVYLVVVRNQVAAISSAEAILTVQPSVVPVPDFQWLSVAGGPAADFGRAVAADREGNVLVAGTFSGQARFGTNTLSSAGGNDIFVAKCDHFGRWLWAQQAGGSLDDSANAVAVDAAGNVYITGAFSGTFGISTLASVRGQDLYVAKYDRDGQLVWVRQTLGRVQGSNIGRGVAVDFSGNVFVTGEFVGTMSFGGNVTLTSFGRTDLFIAKYDSSGNCLWAQRDGNRSDDAGTCIAVDAAGNAFVAGFASSPVIFPPGQFRGPRDFLVRKFDPAGHLLWGVIDGGDNDDYATSLAVDSVGDVYVAGKFSGYDVPGGTNQIFLSKYNRNGLALWGRQTDGENARLAADNTGNVYVAGTFATKATFINTTLHSAGDPDIFVAQFDSAGNLLWLKQAGGPNAETADSLAADGAGNVYLTGSFVSSTAFDTQVIAGQGTDIFVTQLSQFGPSLTLPQITMQPVSQTVLAGGDMQFTVAAVGNPPPTFQWQFNGANLATATKAILVLTNISPAQSGAYSVVVSNVHGSVVSAAARLMVNVFAPLFTLQPTSQAFQAGSDVSFEVGVTGTPPPALQWQFNGANIPGATQPRLVLFNINTNNVSAYGVVASNSAGLVRSAAATLALAPPNESVPTFRGVETFASKIAAFRLNGPALAVDQQGNRYLAGPSEGVIDFGGTTLRGSFVVKQDSAGRVVWARNVGDGRAMAVDASGNVYLAGGREAAKYDANGNLLWATPTSSSTVQEWSAVAVDRSGNVYVGGWFKGSIKIGNVAFSGGSFGVVITYIEAFIAKLDSLGNALWIAGTKHESNLETESKGSRSISLAVDELGNVHVTGVFTGPIDFGGTTLTSSRGLFYDARGDVFLAKYDSAGKLAWVKRAGEGDSDSGLGVAVDSRGNAWVAGKFRGTAAFGSTFLSSAGKDDLFVAKYDSAGQVLWARRAGGTGDDSARGLALDSAGNGYVTGWFNGSAAFDNTQFLRDETNNVFAAKLDPEGNFLWAKRADSSVLMPYDGYIQSLFHETLPEVGIAVDPKGTIYVSSLFQGNARFGETVLRSSHTMDIFVARLAADTPPLPTIAQQPQSQTVVEGSLATFTVGATGTTALRYQWRVNGVDVPSATQATLSIPLAEEGDADTYQVEVRNAGGAVLSQPAQLSVVTPSWVTTLAGSGIAGFKNGFGKDTSFDSPSGAFGGPDGSVFLTDTLNHRIRRIDLSGEVTTVAGTGTAGFADGAGASAQFNSPLGLFVSQAGDIFVADTGNQRIRKISGGASPTVSTLAGSGAIGYQDGPGPSAKFNAPAGLAADSSGNLYIADTGNHTIRKLTQSDDVSTLAGDGVAGYSDGVGKNARFNQPMALAISNDGSLFIADFGNHRIRQVTPEGTVTTIAGDGQAGFVNGPASSTRFNLPRGIALDAAGNLFVTELGNHAVRKITRDGMVSTVAGTGGPGFAEGDGATAQFNQPSGLAMDDAGNLVVVDTANHRVRLIAVGRPRLNVIRSGNDVIFSWPALIGDWVLEFKKDLAELTTWSRVTTPPVLSGRTNTVRSSISGTQNLYRLRRL